MAAVVGVAVVARFPDERRDARYSAEGGWPMAPIKNEKFEAYSCTVDRRNAGARVAAMGRSGVRPGEREGGSLTVKLKKLPRPWNTESVGVGRRRPSSSVICVHKIPRRARPKACRREYH